MNRALEQRIQKARDSKLLKVFEGVKWENGAITETRCNLCGSILMSMVPDDRFKDVRRVGGRTVIRERLLLAKTNNYDEVVLEMDDGAGHVSDVCKQCKPRVLAMGPDGLETLYMADISTLLGFSGPTEYITAGRAETAKPLRAVEVEE